MGAWFPPDERSFATSLFDTASKFSSAIGVPLIGILLLHVGWRLSFAATGVISLLYFALFYFVYCEPEDDPKLSAEEFVFIRAQHGDQEVACKATLGYLLRQRKVIGLSLGFGSYNYVFYLLLTWLPSFLSQSLHVDLLHSFVYTGVPWLIASAMDLFIGGLLVDALVQRGWDANRVRLTVLVGGTALGLGILGVAWSHTPTQALAWISLSIGGLSAAAPVGWSVPSLIAPRGSVGRVGGILNLSNQISGIAAPIITGYLVYARHSFMRHSPLPARIWWWVSAATYSCWEIFIPSPTRTLRPLKGISSAPRWRAWRRWRCLRPRAMSARSPLTAQPQLAAPAQFSSGWVPSHRGDQTIALLPPARRWR